MLQRTPYALVGFKLLFINMLWAMQQAHTSDEAYERFRNYSNDEHTLKQTKLIAQLKACLAGPQPPIIPSKLKKAIVADELVLDEVIACAQFCYQSMPDYVRSFNTQLLFTAIKHKEPRALAWFGCHEVQIDETYKGHTLIYYAHAHGLCASVVRTAKSDRIVAPVAATYE